MKYIYVLIFIIVFVFCGLELGYTNQSPLYTHFTYMFQHSGVVHLIINSLAFTGMFRTMEKFVNMWILSASIIAVSFAASFIAMYDIPTVGASAMIYAMFGLFFGMTIYSKNIKIADTKKYLLFLSVVLISLIISFFKHNSNFVLHLSSMIVGFIISIPISIYDNHNIKK
ncbi:MAG: rhomboid family intramembrane serine protease [Prevotella sp.]|nr:rhomboid family intramembrane serine protease [Prevotella sp.]